MKTTRMRNNLRRPQKTIPILIPWEPQHHTSLPPPHTAESGLLLSESVQKRGRRIFLSGLPELKIS